MQMQIMPLAVDSGQKTVVPLNMQHCTDDVESRFYEYDPWISHFAGFTLIPKEK